MALRRDPPTLVVLRALGLGDLLTVVPALRALAGAFPDHRRILAAPRQLAPLADLTGAVDETVDVGELQPLPQQLRRCDLAVNLHGRGPQSHRLLLDLEPRRLFALANPDVPASADGPAWRAGEHEVRRWCHLLWAYGIEADPADLHLPLPRRRPPPGTAGATVIHPGAKDPARRWPPSRWARVARKERRAGRVVVLTGSADERELARSIARAAGLAPAAVLAGRTDLLALAATVAAAGRVVCGDTGVAHLATAFSTPSVVLFGPVPPSEWGPPDRDRHIALWAGRHGDPHAHSPHPGLLELGVGSVLEALSRLPDRNGRTPAAGRERISAR